MVVCGYHFHSKLYRLSIADYRPLTIYPLTIAEFTGVGTNWFSYSSSQTGHEVRFTMATLDNNNDQHSPQSLYTNQHQLSTTLCNQFCALT